jgi:hypothetical protein
MQKWEYLSLQLDSSGLRSNSKIIFINGERIPGNQQKLFYSVVKELGETGWELVSVEGTHYYFKRPIEE